MKIETIKSGDNSRVYWVESADGDTICFGNWNRARAIEYATAHNGTVTVDKHPARFSSFQPVH